MEKYIIIGCVVLAVIVFVYILTALLGSGYKNKKSLWQTIKSFFDDEPHETAGRRSGAKTMPQVDKIGIENKGDWTVKIIEEDKGDISVGYFSKEEFEIYSFDERERHFKIGRGSGNLQVPDRNEFVGISRNHGYIRYDIANEEYVYWDVSQGGTYTEAYKNTPVRSIPVSDGLKLYIAENVYIEFTDNKKMR